MRKIEILDKEEQRLFDSPKSLPTIDQKNYFTLPEDVKQWSESI